MPSLGTSSTDSIFDRTPTGQSVSVEAYVATGRNAVCSKGGGLVKPVYHEFMNIDSSNRRQDKSPELTG
jgi:hypothetical protein